MSIDRSVVENVAHLARVALDEDQVGSYAADLTNIFKLVEQLETVDTDAISPMAHPLSMTQRLRIDEVTEPDMRDDYQAVAPQVEDGLFLVPKVIE